MAEEGLDDVPPVDDFSQSDGDHVKREEDHQVAQDALLVLRQLRPERIDAEEGDVGLDLNQEIHSDTLHRVAADEEGINEVEDEDADHEKKAPVEGPRARLRRVVAEEAEDEQRADLVDVAKAQPVDHVVKHHAEDEREDQ